MLANYFGAMSAHALQRFFALQLVVFSGITLSTNAATFTVTTTHDSGPGSLRQAILDANSLIGTDSIRFNIGAGGVQSISLVTALPAISDPLILDGSTQPGFAGQPLIELNGATVATGSGLRISSPGCTVRGLVINRFPDEGVRIENSGATIQGNYIGTSANGSIARANGQQGIFIWGASDNLIGGTDITNRNLVSGNKDVGIYIFNAEGNRIEGNYIGTTANGLSALGNTNHGIVLYNSPRNTIGAASPGAGNLISGNLGSGVYLYGATTTGNALQANQIGTDSSGVAPLRNCDDGVSLYLASGNLIGGVDPGAGNLISGNGLSGISCALAANNFVQGNRIGTAASGNAALSNRLAGITFSAGACSNLVGGLTPQARNLIAGNGQDGIFLTTNATANTVAGNYIGVSAAGTQGLPNGYNGISIASSHSNLIGGTLVQARNIISGNTYHGIQLYWGASGNLVHGNFIGMDAAGKAGISNKLSGVRLDSHANSIGGPVPGAGNLISANGQDGIYLVGSGAHSNAIQGNLIGTRFDGVTGLGNQRGGIGFSGAPRNLVGGSPPPAGNVISANGNSGIFFIERAAAWNTVQGNKIGTDLTGAIDLGNTYDGIHCSQSVSNTFGGPAPGQGNLVSGNNNGGIYLFQSAWNQIQGNYVGTQADGLTPLGNSMAGVECDAAATNNVIGGSIEGANHIAFSQPPYVGVRIRSGALRNRITYNRIFGNGGLGIDLGTSTVTPNDLCDTDGGANGLQNFPLLTNAVTGSATLIAGRLNSTANRTFLIQFFANATCETDGNGEGEWFLGEIYAATDANCIAPFLATFPLSLPPGYVVTATATDNLNNTSEFSACHPLTPAPALKATTSSQGLTLSWPTTPARFVLKQTASLTPPVQWITVTDAPATSGDHFLLTLPTLAGTNLFYTLAFE